MLQSNSLGARPLCYQSVSLYDLWCLSGGASMKLQPEEQEAVGWDDDEELVIDEGECRCLGGERVSLCVCRWCYCGREA